MPAYNAEKYIAEAIDSVIQQSCPDWELIIVDDGSTDRTAAIIKEYENDQRIHYIYQEHVGQGKARNKAISQTGGEYIAFLDADDCWLPGKLQQQLSIIEEKKVDLVFSDAYLFEDKPDFEKRMNITPGYYQGEEAVRKFLVINYIPILTVLAKKSAIEKVNGFTEKEEIHEDYHLWLRMLISGSSFLGIDSALACYRQHPASSTLDAGKVLLYDIHVLQSIEDQWPRYKNDIDISVFCRIKHHLASNNVNEKKALLYLLNQMNDLGPGKVSVPFWKNIYSFFGKNIFRMLFNRLIRKRRPVHHPHQYKILLA
jgi:glycosyltransferase involved in cell wall biosynthesis